MPADAFDKAQYAALLLQENDLEEELEEARQDVLLWVKRGRLAAKVGEKALAQQAKAKATEAKQRFVTAQAEIDRLAFQKKSLRKEARRPDERATFDAE